MYSTLVNYFKSPYFRLGPFLCMVIIAAFGTALFPFDNLSIAYITDVAVITVAILGACTAALVIMWVGVVWYVLKQQEKKITDKLALWLLYMSLGILVPMMLIILQVILVFGLDFLSKHEMHYHLWLYAILLCWLNMYYKVLSLEVERDRLTLEWENTKKDKGDLSEQIEGMKQQITECQQEIQTLIREKSDLSQQLSEVAMQYIIRTGKKQKTFRRNQIGGFMITDRETGGRPIIHMFLNDQTSLVDHRNSLTKVSKELPEMRLVLRDVLVSPETIIGYSEIDEGKIALHVQFLKEPLVLSKGQWPKHREWVEGVLEERKKMKASQASPDALEN